MIKGVSLFSGAGGMDIGFKKAGIDVVLANELNKDACNTFASNHPEVELLRGDIITFYDRFRSMKDVDIVFGGPPCQGFSVAGKMDPDDERSQLIWRYLEVVDIIHPKVFVMENVKALGELEKWGEIRKRYIDTVTKMGYYCNYTVLNSAEFGVSQKRERVFFIGSLTPFTLDDFKNELEKEKKDPPTLRSLLKSLPAAGTDGNPLTCTAKITLAETPVMRKSPYAGMLFNGLGRPMKLDSVSQTLPASMGGNKTPIIDTRLLADEKSSDWIQEYHDGIIDGSIVPQYKPAPDFFRRLTIKEAALIQGFPNEYNFCGNTAAVYCQIGNAVPCGLAESVARSVIRLFLGGKHES